MSLTRRSLLAGGLAVGIAVQAQAAVTLLQRDDSTVLVLVDEQLLDKPLLARLAAQGFGQDVQGLADCPLVDFALLVDRIRLSGEVIALLGPANHVLVMEALREVGARVQVDVPAAAVPVTSDNRELLALRAALAPAKGLQALRATVDR